MYLHEIKAKGVPLRKRKRVGRGRSSGHGKTCGRGQKGQKSRAGSFGSPLFAGGQTPLFRRLPRRGFNSHVEKPAVVNVGRLNVFEPGTVIDIELLKEKGLVRKRYRKVKILGEGKLDRPLTVRASAFSRSAAEAIESAGGKAETVS